MHSASSASSGSVIARSVRLADRFRSSSRRRAASRSAAIPAHRISSVANRLRALISSEFRTAHSRSALSDSRTSLDRARRASQRGAQNSSSAVAITCTSVGGGLYSFAFANVSATSRFNSSTSTYGAAV